MIEYLRAAWKHVREKIYVFWLLKVKPHAPKIVMAIRWDIDHQPGRILDRGHAIHRIHDHEGCVEHGAMLDTFVSVEYPFQLVHVLHHVQQVMNDVHTKGGLVGELADRVEEVVALMSSNAAQSNQILGDILRSRRDEMNYLWPAPESEAAVFFFGVTDDEGDGDPETEETNEQFFAMIDREDWNLGPDH